MYQSSLYESDSSTTVVPAIRARLLSLSLITRERPTIVTLFFGSKEYVLILVLILLQASMIHSTTELTYSIVAVPDLLF